MNPVRFPRTSLLALILIIANLVSFAQDNPQQPVAPEAPAVPETPAAPEEPTPPDRPLLRTLAKKSGQSDSDPEVVRIGESVHVLTNETVRSVVVIQSSATIDGRVEQDLVVIGGKARINGSVGGNVVNVGGGVVLGPGARIDGNAVGVLGGIRMSADSQISGDACGIGGGVSRASGAVIKGETIDQHFPMPFGNWTGPDGFELPSWVNATGRQILLKCRPLSFRVGWVWMVAGVFLLGYLLLAQVAPGMVRAISTTLTERGATAFLMGLLALPLGALITLFLGITIVGFVVVPFVAAASFFAAFAGKAGLLHFLGTSLVRRPERELPMLGGILLGAAFLSALYLIPFLGIVSWAVFSMWALGAALLALLSRFRKERPPASPGTMPLAATPVPAPATDTAPSATSAAFATPRVAQTLLSIVPGATIPVVDAPEPSTPTSPSPTAGAAAGESPSSEIPMNESSAPPLPPMPSRTPPLPDALSLPRVALKERLLATALDWLLLLMLFQFIHLEGNRWRVLLAIGYFAGFWIWRQTTLGGIVLRLQVVRLDGRALDPATAFVRSLGALFGSLALGLGYFWCAWDPDRQGWHDKIAGTVVVRTPKTQPLV